MTHVLDFVFDSLLGRTAAGLALVAGLITWFAYDQRITGARNAVAKIEQQTNEAIAAADRASSKSFAAGRGLLNPYYRD